MSVIKINHHEIALTHEDMLYFPRSKITKGELLDYYQKIAPILIPYCHNRAITMDRFPGGIMSESFYQKNAGDYFPAWITRHEITNKSAGSKQPTTSYVVCQNAATLVYIANQGCITPHMWLSTIDHLEYPDVLIFDLDPAGEKVTHFKRIIDTAYALKKILEDHGLSAFVMTTGSRGLHVRVPIQPECTFDQVRTYAKKVAEIVITSDPAHLTLESHKEKRKNKLLIDIMRNSFGATAVIPYAVRAREHAPVATPLAWHELGDSTLRSDTYTLKTIFKRLKEKGDVWKEMHRHAPSLKKALTHSTIDELLY